jgi:DNA-binding PadR family transcriptional regulator
MLHKMEADGLLKIELEYVGKRIRKYYSLTETGASQVEIKLKEFAAFVKTMSAVLQLKLT